MMTYLKDEVKEARIILNCRDFSLCSYHRLVRRLQQNSLHSSTCRVKFGELEIDVKNHERDVYAGNGMMQLKFMFT